MPSEEIRVTDDAGVEFLLGQKIAEGAQGAVHRVVGYPDFAIKLLTRPNDLERIEQVRRLPLDGLPVASPITLIRTGGAGYVMRLADEMTPLREPYLPREFGPREDVTWYLATGGLRRRLAIAANLASAVAGLHARGLAYVDLNPNNVMVSEDPTRDATWLIDTDNLTSMTEPSWDIIGFPGYVAPERRRHSPPTTLADAYSLGVIVFRMLVLSHPLMGAATFEVEGKTADHKIDLGQFPYVDDPDDETNRLPPGSLPAGLLSLALSGRLRQLCQRTFGAGRLTPTSRPGSSRWREILFTALDNVIECPNGCGWTYFRLTPKCPKCNGRTGPTTLLTIYPGKLETRLSARDSLAVSGSGTRVLPRHVWGRYDDADPVLTVRPVTGGYELTPHGETVVTNATGRRVTRVASPTGNDVSRVLLSTPGRPDRTIALRSVPTR
jgi:serine/threonine protein kinase